MELFFIFCAVLVLYSGYLTIIDLLQDRQKAMTPAQPERSRVKQSLVRRCGVAERDHVGSVIRQFATFSRGAV